MLLEIDHHSGVPIYRQVIEQIRQQIMAGLWTVHSENSEGQEGTYQGQASGRDSEKGGGYGGAVWNT